MEKERTKFQKKCDIIYNGKSETKTSDLPIFFYFQKKPISRGTVQTVLFALLKGVWSICPQLYNGDCLEVMQKMKEKSIDMVLCDLPYGITNCKWDSIIPFDKLWEQYNRIIKPGGVIVLFSAQPFTTKLIYSNPTHFKYCWYWKKNNVTGFAFAKTQPMRMIEDICVFYNNSDNAGEHCELRQYFLNELKKSGLKRSEIDKLLNNSMSSHYFTNGSQFAIPKEKDYLKLQSTGFFKRSYNDILKEYKSKKKEQRFTYNPQGVIKLEKTQNRDKSGTKNEIYKGMNGVCKQTRTNYPRQLLEFENVPTNKRLHPTQKPVALLEYLIKTYTNEGETVLDNCMGSGSTGEACLNTGRRFIGIEKDEYYYKMAKERLTG